MRWTKILVVRKIKISLYKINNNTGNTVIGVDNMKILPSLVVCTPHNKYNISIFKQFSHLLKYEWDTFNNGLKNVPQRSTYRT